MTGSKSIGIIGGGAVGKAISAYYPAALIYDKYRPVDPIEKVAAQDYIFVAVPTPFQGGQADLTEMDDAIASTVRHLTNPSQQIIIIKSTVVPGTTERYQIQYPQANFAFNPEFLTEKTAVEDFAKPDKQVLGYTAKTESRAQEILENLPPAPFMHAYPAKTCELAKYAINSFYAFKVIFANTLYELCDCLGVDYNYVREAVVRDKRIIDSHFDVLHGGYRGYGGKCLPKDIRTLVWFGNKYGFNPEFIKTVIDLNDKLEKDRHLKIAKT